MEGMSWSDDTRCLYCEGRLPLYRKITHGQFCSSAHRKAYWQEHERLALERLHEAHSSLRSYRPLEATRKFFRRLLPTLIRNLSRKPRRLMSKLRAASNWLWVLRSTPGRIRFQT